MRTNNPHVETIVSMMANTERWGGVRLSFYGESPTIRDISGAMTRIAPWLVAREVSSMLVQGGAGKGYGTYVGVMPEGSTDLRFNEKLEKLVPDLRIFVIRGHSNELTVRELPVATPDELQEARDRAAEHKRELAKRAELKQREHDYFDRLFHALATLTERHRSELPRCNDCDDCTKMCAYGTPQLIQLCDDAGIDIITVMMEAVTSG